MLVELTSQARDLKGFVEVKKKQIHSSHAHSVLEASMVPITPPQIESDPDQCVVSTSVELELKPVENRCEEHQNSRI